MNGTTRTRRSPFAWLAAFFGFVAVAHGNFETTDAGFTMHAAHGLWTRGDSGLRLAEQGGELPGERAGAFDIHASQREGNRRNGKVGANGLAYVWFPVGHVWLLVPLVAAGDAMRRALPDVERAYRDRVAPGVPDGALVGHGPYREGSPVLMQASIALLLPAACAATMLLLLARIARQLGAAERDAWIAALAIVVGTQCFALGRETLSDGPGLVLLLAALTAVVAVHRGAGARTAVFAGLLASAAVVLRYPNVLAVAAFVVAIVLACRRRASWAPLAAFVLGGVPLAVLFLATNHARFGNPFDTGYPDAGDWFDQPPWLGLGKLLFAAGRGILWLSPLLWLALPLAARRGAVRELRWLAWTLLLLPLLLFATAQGWHGGRNWGCRYVTPGVVTFLALVLPQVLPWRRWRTVWVVLVAIGVAANVTSVVAPVRGVIQLSTQAFAAAGGRGDADDVVGWHPRYTPLLVNWRYAAATWRGDYESADGTTRHGSAHTIEPLFGVAARTPEQGFAPVRWEDRGFRHLWWRFAGALAGVPGTLLLAPVLVLAALFAVLAARGGRPASTFPTAR